MSKVIFKHPEQNKIYPPLLDALNQVCTKYGKDADCVRGYSSLEDQKAINAKVLSDYKSKGAYQITDKKSPMYGAVYVPKYDAEGKHIKDVCRAGAFGKSNHNYCLAGDLVSPWFEALTDKDLKPFGLHKPAEDENWHTELIATHGFTQTQKEAVRDSVLNGVKKEESVVMGKAFKDVDDSRWSAKHIEAAKELGLISGNKDGNFDPEGPLLREQGAVLMVRLYEKITGKKVI